MRTSIQFRMRTAIFFMYGVVGFLLVFLFLYQFWGVYEFGQNAIWSMTRWAAPVDRLVAKLFPFYMIIIIIVFYFVANILDNSKMNYYFMFFIGFSAAMHVFLTAQSLQEDEKMLIKPTYLLMINLTIISTIVLTVLLTDLVFEKFTFPSFFNSVMAHARKLYAIGLRKFF